MLLINLSSDSQSQFLLKGAEGVNKLGTSKILELEVVGVHSCHVMCVCVRGGLDWNGKSPSQTSNPHLPNSTQRQLTRFNLINASSLRFQCFSWFHFILM